MTDQNHGGSDGREQQADREQYAHETLDAPNPIARFAHRRRHATGAKLCAEHLRERGVILDYGCGQGDLLIAVSAHRPNAVLFGFDPESGHESERYQVVEDMSGVGDQSVDVFGCFEALEHMHRDEQLDAYRHMTRVLSPAGTAIISVPIIGGPPVLLKEANKMVMTRSRSEYSIRELSATALLGRPASPSPKPRVSHKGFDFRTISFDLHQRFETVDIRRSPFGSLPWFMNSQVFFLCTGPQPSIDLESAE